MFSSTRCRAKNPALCDDPNCPEKRDAAARLLGDRDAFFAEVKAQSRISARRIVPSQEFDFDEHTKLAFTDGDCGDLALALHELTGWPIVGSDNHYYCIEPSGRKPIDVLGIHTVGAKPNDYGVTYTYFGDPIDPEVIREDAKHRSYPGSDPKPVAARIVEIYNAQR